MKTLLSEDQIKARVQALGAEIRRDHPGDVHLICVLKGAFMFMADLIRALPGDTSIDFMAQDVEVYRTVASQGAGRPTITGGKLEVTKDEPLRLELADFVDAARSGRAPTVTAQAGRDALALATRIAEEMEAAL